MNLIVMKWDGKDYKHAQTIGCNSISNDGAGYGVSGLAVNHKDYFRNTSITGVFLKGNDIHIYVSKG